MHACGIQYFAWDFRQLLTDCLVSFNFQWGFFFLLFFISLPCGTIHLWTHAISLRGVLFSVHLSPAHCSSQVVASVFFLFVVKSEGNISSPSRCVKDWTVDRWNKRHWCSLMPTYNENLTCFECFRCFIFNSKFCCCGQNCWLLFEEEKKKHWGKTGIIFLRQRWTK